jgi:hypothetical protein
VIWSNFELEFYKLYKQFHEGYVASDKTISDTLSNNEFNSNEKVDDFKEKL